MRDGNSDIPDRINSSRIQPGSKTGVEILPPISGHPWVIRILGLVSLLTPLFLYYLTTCPVVYFGDAGELTVAAYRWGIAHPPGYPGYTIPLGIFLRLPLSFLAPDAEFLQPIAWQANFFSAVIGALTIWVVFLIILRLARSPWIALAGAILAMVGKTFWSQTGIAEVYTLNALLASLMVLIAIIQGESKPGSKERVKWLRWGSVIWGFSLTNHHEMAFFFPLWLVIVGLAMVPGPGGKRPACPPARSILEGIIFVAIGLIPYLYLPIASSFKPPLNWGDPGTLTGFFKVLTRADYRQVKEGITGSLVTPIDVLTKFIFWSFLQYGPIIILFALPGFSIFFKRSPHRPALVATLLALTLMNTVFIIYFAGIDRGSVFFLEVYFIPWYLAIAVLVAIGFSRAPMWFKFRSPASKVVYTIVAVGLILVFGILAFRQNYKVSDMSDNIAGYIYSHDVLASMRPEPEKNILVTGGDEIFLYWYWKWVEGIDKDVAVIGTDALGISSSWFWDDVSRDQPSIELPTDDGLDQRYEGDELRVKMLESIIRENRHVYRVFMTVWDPIYEPILTDGPWHMVLDGPVLEIEWDTEVNFSDHPRLAFGLEEFKFRALLDIDRDHLAPFEEEVYDRYAAACYNLALFADRHDEHGFTIDFAGLCLEFQPDYNPGEGALAPRGLLAVSLTKAGNLSDAKIVFQELIDANPQNSLYHLYIAEIYFAEGNIESSKMELEIALEIEPENVFILERYNNLIEFLETLEPNDSGTD
jgi:hypothetical protein